MTTKRMTLIGIVLLMILAACAPVQPADDLQAPGDPTEGENVRKDSQGEIEGQVFLGPGCAAQQSGEACEEQVFPAVIAVLDQSGQKLDQIQTDQAGEFTLSLAPGTYTLQPMTLEAAAADQPDESDEPTVPQSERYPRADEMVVTVQEDEVTTVTIYFDTGVR